MKKTILLLTTILLFSSCDNLFQKMITIKGSIPTNAKVSGSRVKSINTALSLADAKKVLIFYGNKYALAEIKNGTFSTQAPEGSATCLVFLDANNQFIGNLFAGGLNILPLVGLNSTSIDLSTLTLDGTNVVPANDPIGSTINISSDEIAFMKSVGAYYQTLAKNIDMDNDGSPDIINGDQLRVNSVVNLSCGTFGNDSKEPAMTSPANFQVNYGIRIAGAIAMYDKDFTVLLTNQATQVPITLNWDPIKDGYPQASQADEFILIFQQNQQSGLSPAFADGVYNFQLSKDRQFTFNFSNINMQNYMMIIKPTFHVDKDGNISKISYEFVFPDGKPANPHNLIQGYIRSQMSNNSTQLYEGHHLYGTFSASSDYDYYNETLTKKIKLSEVDQCNFAYIDIMGNEYNFGWRK